MLKIQSSENSHGIRIKHSLKKGGAYGSPDHNWDAYVERLRQLRVKLDAMKPPRSEPQQRPKSEPKRMPRAGAGTCCRGQIIRVLGDGNCLFGSLVYGLNRLGIRDRNARYIRTQIVHWLREHPDQVLENFTTVFQLHQYLGDHPDKTWEEYLQFMNTDTNWGGAVEATAFAFLYPDIRLRLWEDKRDHILLHYDFNSEQEAIINIVRVRRGHYDALINVIEEPCPPIVRR